MTRFTNPTSCPSAGGRHRFRPRVEGLEPRTAPAVFTVVNLLDFGAGAGLEGDLRYCLEAANANGDPHNYVQFQDGLTGTITLERGELHVTKGLALIGPGPQVLTVSGDHRSRVFRIESSGLTTITGLTVADGLASGSVSIDRIGGGIFGYGSLGLWDVWVTRNTAYEGGGGIFHGGGTLTLTDSPVWDNTAGYGGGLNTVGDTRLYNSVVWANRAGYGGGIDIPSGRLTLVDSWVLGNIADIGGGGINALTARGVEALLERSVIQDNYALYGGGIYADEARFRLYRTTVRGNVARQGGGIYADDHAEVEITDSFVQANEAAEVGGGICSLNITQLTIRGSTLADNRAATGGGIYDVASLLLLDRSTVSGNAALNGNGGGLWSAAVQVEILSSTITGNTAAGDAKNGRGGGLYVDGPSPLVILLGNTLVAGNAASSGSPDVFGDLTSLGYNLIGIADGSTGWVASDLRGSAAAPLDARLAPLGDYGGPTPTHALLPDSPARDAGDPALAGILDQRGRKRDARPDIGAFELPL